MAEREERRYKFWCFTSFEAENEPKYDQREIEYMVYDFKTCPDTGRQYYQGFICCRTRKRFTHIQKMVPNAHFEKYKGSFHQNLAYCTKGVNIKEFGKRPASIGYTCKFSKPNISAEEDKLDAVKSESLG